MWNRQSLVQLARSPRVVGGAACAVSLLVGAGSGYLLTRQRESSRWRTHYDTLYEEKLRETKEYYEKLISLEKKVAEKTPPAEDRPLSPQEVLTRLYSDPTKKSETLEGIISTGRPAVETIVEDKSWDYVREIAQRAENPLVPYIISDEEFFENEPEHEQVSLTYYEEDDTLVDDHDVPVPDPDTTVGDDNLIRFGHGSKDPHMVYIRNDTLEMDFEIARDPGKFSVKVLGFDDPESLKHGVRKFRRHDE